MNQPKRLNEKKGFSVLEAMMAGAIFLVIALGVAYFVSGFKTASKSSENASSCQGLLAEVITSIKSMDNSTVVRSWVPTNVVRAAWPTPSNKFGPPEPFCLLSRDTSELCAGTEYVPANGSLTVAAGAAPNPDQITNVGTFQNIRNSASWAHAFYNNHGSSICTGKGLEFRMDWLPQPVGAPTWLDKMYVKIEEMNLSDSSVSCPAVSRAKPNSQYGFRITVEAGFKEQGADRSCTAQTLVAYEADRKPTNFIDDGVNPIVLTIDGGGVPLQRTRPSDSPYPPGNQALCSCTKTYGKLMADGGQCPNMFTVRNVATFEEPGVTVMCSTSGNAGTWQYCDGFATGGGIAQVFMVDSDGTRRISRLNQIDVEYNKSKTRLAVELQSLNLGQTVDFWIAAFDSAGNVTSDASGNLNKQRINFEVKMPSCPARNTYCDRDVVWDGCGKTCPTGQLVGTCNTGAVCPGQLVLDSCGKPCGSGTKNLTYPNSNNICPPEPILDNQGCGTLNGIGTKNDCPNSNTYCTFETKTNSCGVSCGPGTYVACSASFREQYCYYEDVTDFNCIQPCGTPCGKGTYGAGIPAPNRGCEHFPLPMSEYCEGVRVGRNPCRAGPGSGTWCTGTSLSPTPGTVPAGTPTCVMPNPIGGVAQSFTPIVPAPTVPPGCTPMPTPSVGPCSCNCPTYYPGQPVPTPYPQPTGCPACTCQSISACPAPPTWICSGTVWPPPYLAGSSCPLKSADICNPECAPADPCDGTGRQCNNPNGCTWNGTRQFLCGQWCFTGDTLVTLVDGSQKPIREVRMGDQVLSFDAESKAFLESSVTYVHVHNGHRVLRKLYLNDGTTLTGTPEHRISVIKKGTSGFTWIALGGVQFGDLVMKQIGTDLKGVEIKEMDDIPMTGESYNLEVSTKSHSYFANDVLVHNMKAACDCTGCPPVQ